MYYGTIFISFEYWDSCRLSYNIAAHIAGSALEPVDSDTLK